MKLATGGQALFIALDDRCARSAATHVQTDPKGRRVHVDEDRSPQPMDHD